MSKSIEILLIYLFVILSFLGKVVEPSQNRRSQY